MRAPVPSSTTSGSLLEGGLDLNGTGVDAQQRLDRASEPFGQADPVALQTDATEASTRRRRSPESVLETQLGLDGEVSEVVVEEASGVKLRPIDRAIVANDSDSVASVGQLGELHVHDDKLRVRRRPR